MDFEGNVIKSFRNHQATVNDISIDKSDEFVASASDDGKKSRIKTCMFFFHFAKLDIFKTGSVYIYALYTDEIQHFNYKRPIKSVALDPNYARKNTRQFVSGGMAEQLIMSEKRAGWLGTKKDVVLHANEGPIYAIRWRNNFIAWANDTGVKIYDTTTNVRITFIDRPEGSPRADLYKCRMCWKNDTTLLIGWADTVKVAVIKPKVGPVPAGQPGHFVEITTIFQTDYMISGIAPFNDTLMLLSYILEEDEEEEIEEEVEQQENFGRKRLAAKPELHIINQDNEEISADVLALHGYEHYQANDYVLDFLMEEDMFYIMGPKDLIAARSRDQDDHIEWLLEHEKFGEALTAVRLAGNTTKKFNEDEIGQTYLNWLITEKRFDEAAQECPSILKHDQTLWEDWVFKFTELGELKAIAPFIPIKDPQLSTTVYEIALAWFIKSDHVMLRNTIRQWPKTLYSLSNVIVAVEDYFKKDKNDEVLLECLADL